MSHCYYLSVPRVSCDGLLQRQRIAPYPRRRKRIFPKRPAGSNHDTVVLGPLGGRERPSGSLAQRSACSTEPRCPFHPPLSDRNLGQPPGQGRMVFLRPIRRPNFNISSYNPDARAPSPASYATSRGWTACARRPTHSPCHETKPGSLLAYRHDVEDCSFSQRTAPSP